VKNHFSRTYLTVACCSGYFVLGLVISLIGVALEAFAEQLSASAAEVGSHFFFYIGTTAFIMLFAAGPLIDRFGQKPVLVAGSLLCGAAMLLVSQANSLASAGAAMFVLGSGAAGLNGGINTLINNLYSRNPGLALNLVNTFYGLGAVFLPLLAGWLFMSLGLFHLLLTVSFFCLLTGILFILGGFPADIQVTRFRIREAFQALSDPLVWLLAGVLFFYLGLEVSLGIWSRAAMVEKWQLQGPFDQMILAGYWSCLVVGRLLAGTLFKHIPGHRLVLLSAVGSCIGLSVFILAPSMQLAASALWFSGLCFGPIFPSTLGSAGICFKKYTGTIFSIIMAGGILGGVILSSGMGKIAGASSLHQGFRLILAGAGLMLITQILVGSRIKKYLRQN